MPSIMIMTRLHASHHRKLQNFIFSILVILDHSWWLLLTHSSSFLLPMVVSYAASHSWIRYLTRWGSWIKEMLGILTFIRLGNIIALSAVAICCNCNYKNCIRCMSCILFYFNRYICLCRCLIRASHALFLSKTGIFLSSLQHFSVFVKFLSTNDSIGLRMECTYMSLFVIKACLAISSFSLFFFC